MLIAKLFPAPPQSGQPAPALAWVVATCRITSRLFLGAADAEALGRSSAGYIEAARFGIERLTLACDGVLCPAFVWSERPLRFDELMSGAAGAYGIERRTIGRISDEAAIAGRLLAGRDVPSPGSLRAAQQALARVGRGVQRLSRNYPSNDATVSDREFPHLDPAWRRVLRETVANLPPPPREYHRAREDQQEDLGHAYA